MPVLSDCEALVELNSNLSAYFIIIILSRSWFMFVFFCFQDLSSSRLIFLCFGSKKYPNLSFFSVSSTFLATTQKQPCSNCCIRKHTECFCVWFVRIFFFLDQNLPKKRFDSIRCHSRTVAFATEHIISNIVDYLGVIIAISQLRQKVQTPSIHVFWLFCEK